MSLSSLVGTAPKNRFPCKFRDWFNSLNAEDQNAVNALFDDPRWSDSQLTAEFAVFGCPVGRERVTHHRHGVCKSCGPRQ